MPVPINNKNITDITCPIEQYNYIYKQVRERKADNNPVFTP